MEPSVGISQMAPQPLGSMVKLRSVHTFTACGQSLALMTVGTSQGPVPIGIATAPEAPLASVPVATVMPKASVKVQVAPFQPLPPRSNICITKHPVSRHMVTDMGAVPEA